MVRAFCAIVFLALTACASVNLDEVQAGQFHGTVHVVWVGEGSDTSGDGLFVYLPQPGDELRFVRPNTSGPGTSAQVIEPYAIYTDGGSIPRLATLYPGLSPWGYGPAYIIHDFLFIARICGRSEEPWPQDDFAREMDFNDTVEIMAEALKTLMEQDLVAERPVSGQLVTYGVSTGISREIWETGGDCASRRLPQSDPLLIRARNAFPEMRIAGFDASAPMGVPVATISFDENGRPVAQFR